MPNKVLERMDAIHSQIAAVNAILDCAKVLTALERSQEPAELQPEQSALGQGAANGHILCDDSLPALLAHGTDLMDDLKANVEAVYEAAQGNVEGEERRDG